ncbi:sterol desaturase family protein [Halpernia sp. GG3]
MGDFITYIFIFFGILLLRYFAAAGSFYAYYHKVKSSKTNDKILSKRPPKTAQIEKEIFWSITSSAIFAFFGAVTYWLYLEGFTAIYVNLTKFGIWYLPVSMFLVLIIHETYYYWLHRGMHFPKVYKIIHKVHHNSLSSTPWTAFSFHPWESILEALIVPIILIFLPVNIYVLLFYLVFMTFSSVINHLDIEVYPESFRKSAFGKLWIDATHHHFHHKEFVTNYGLYFTFWDKIMKTESRKME